MNYIFTCIALILAEFTFGQRNQDAALPSTMEAHIDTLFNAAYPNNSPGATVLIAKDDQIIYRKAFGMANLELNVPMKPENVFQLASITKQFTSVAILMLMEEGKLSLQDPLSTFISDYPRGNEITLHHLLNHTSGIKDYTRIPEMRTQSALDLSPEELIASFKDLPMEFNPGEQQDYCNSGYVLLGYIIEQLSGMSYGEFIQSHIFDKLGMKHSSYADPYKMTPERAYGYQLYEGNYENAAYTSPTFAYAAGSLMSTVDDLFLWNKAIHHNTLISEDSKRMAFTNHSLSNGNPSNYGYGWFINEIAGISTLEHPGGTSGYTTSGIYVPDRNIYAIVLSNLDDGNGPETNNLKSVSILLGEPMADDVAIKLSDKELEKWVGAYQFEDVVRFISNDQGVLYSTREGGRPLKLEPISPNEFRFENSFTTYQFSTIKGKKHVLYTNRIVKSAGVETDKKPVEEKESIHLAPEILLKYIGVYELQPSFHLEIEMQENRLIATTSGQPSVELFAETESRFFIKEIGAQVWFTVDEQGTVTGLTFSQGNHALEGKRIK